MADEGMQARLRLLEAVLDRLVPPVDDLPGAGGLGLASRVVTAADSIARFGEALGSVEAELATVLDGGDFATLDAVQQTTTLRAVEQERPAAFATFVQLTFLVYYGDSRVHQRIGWRSGGVQPLGFELPPFEESILDAIRRREPFWRQV